MLLSLFAVALVTVVLTSADYSSAQDIPPAGDTVAYAFAVFRHGARSPKFKFYPMFTATDENTQPFKGFLGKLIYPGSLTRIGKRQMYQVGKNLALRYGSFIGKYAGDNVYVSARASSRTMMTALTILAGLLPPNPTIFKDLPWQPIPVWGLSEDKSDLFHDLQFKSLHLCPKYEFLANKVKENILDKADHAWQRLKMYDIIQTNTGTKVDSLSTLFPIYDTLQAQETNAVALPEWATRTVPGIGKTLYPEMMREAIDSWYKNAFSRELLTFHIGPVFSNMYEKFKAKAAKLESSSKLSLHVTEDTTMIALLSRLGLAASASYDPGNGLIFELHYDNTDTTVKIFSYNANTHTMKELESSYCMPPCTLEKFMRQNRAVPLPEWEKDCEIPETQKL